MVLSVMVVDDSTFMRNLLKKIIIENGANVIAEAGNGKEAIEKYSQFKPSLVFMDIVMPEMDGISALKNIKTSYPDSRIVMCTSAGQEMITKEAIAAGASDFVIKPFSNNDIIAIIKRFS
jgi:two-component system, chemotaxis family, chemotaxis protein CheY